MLLASTSHAQPNVCSIHTHAHKNIRAGWRQSRYDVDPVTLRFLCHTFRLHFPRMQCSLQKCHLHLSSSHAKKTNFSNQEANVTLWHSGSVQGASTNLTLRDAAVTALQQKGSVTKKPVAMFVEKSGYRMTLCCLATELFFSAQHLNWWKYVSELGWLPVSVFDSFLCLLNERRLLIPPPPQSVPSSNPFAWAQLNLARWDGHLWRFYRWNLQGSFWLTYISFEWGWGCVHRSGPLPMIHQG